MLLRNELNFLLALSFGLVASQSNFAVPSINDMDFRKECLESHNDIRTLVRPTAANMMYMTWDESLAKNAEAWVNHCKFEHNSNLKTEFCCHPTFRYVGENIRYAQLEKFIVANSILKWEDERKYYNITTLQCSAVCGHYTQVVWANSYKLGCAMKKCPELGGPETVLFVCNYGPAGNYQNTRPYIEGKPCSKCEKGDTCEKNLCRNANREKPIDAPGWKPKGEAPQWTACNLLCLVYIYLRIF